MSGAPCPSTGLKSEAGVGGKPPAGARPAAAVSMRTSDTSGYEAPWWGGGGGPSIACEDDGVEDEDSAGFRPDVGQVQPSPSSDDEGLPRPPAEEEVELLPDVADGNSMMSLQRIRGGDSSRGKRRRVRKMAESK